MTAHRFVFCQIAFWSIVAAGIGAGVAWGQLGDATVVGRVQDSQGAVIIGAHVEVKRISTNQVFTAVTTASGDYSIVNLPVDTYEFRASSPGFKTEVQSGITLRVGATIRVDFNLVVGAITESVKVVSEAPLLRTEKPELGQVISNAQITGAPLNSRDILGTLGGLAPGLAPSRGNPTGSADNFNVRGARVTDNVVLIDGSYVTNGNAGMTFLESPEAVQEFEIKTGLYDAQYGVRPGGQLIMITKSGTNTPHGTLFELLRNNDMDARNFFTPGSTTPYKRNQFGGVFGAPIIVPKLFNGKDRAWFFFSYAGERIRQFSPATGVVPTEAQKSGQFATTVRDPLTGQPFPNNTIPANRINPISQKLLSFYPSPNTAGSLNFTSPNSSANSNNDQVIAKVDFNVSPNDRWSARFLWDNSPITRTNAIQTFFRVDPVSSFTQEVSNTHTFKSRVVNEFSASWFRRPYYAGKQSSIAGFGNTIGIAGFPASPTDVNGVPMVSITGFLTLGDGNNSGPSITGNWEIRDNVSFNKGAHSLKFGYNWKRHIEQFEFEGRSNFAFQNRYTGNAFADFLLGYAYSTSPGAEGLHGRMYQNSQFFYAQDSWKVSSHLTVDLGLRFEYHGPWFDQRGFAANFLPLSNQYSPPLQNLQLQPWQTGRFVAGEPLFTFRTLGGLQPRVGLAYRLTPKTVIRAGYAIFGNEPFLGYVQGLGTNPRPNVTAKTYLSDPTTPNLTFANPFPSTVAAGSTTPLITGFESPLPVTQVHSWGFSIQHQFANNTLVEIGYQGSRTEHEYIYQDANDATPGPGSLQSRRPYPQYNAIHIIQGNGDSKYNGLELKFEQRVGQTGLSALVSYTWSKALDDMGGRMGASGETTGVSRNVTMRSNNGPGEQNPNRFVANLNYELPFGRGRRLLSSGIGSALAGGWSFSSILSIETGYYVTAIIPNDLWNVGSTTSLRPNVSNDPNLPVDQRTPQHWFNTSVFSQPAQYQYGNAGRGLVEGPGFINLDLSLHRDFRIHERARLQFRADAFNATNHTNFNLPGLSYGTASFGVVGSAFTPRDIQLGLKFAF